MAPDPTPLVDTNPADNNQVPDPTPLHDPDLSDNDSLERHFFVKDAKLTGEVTLAASGVTGSGQSGSSIDDLSIPCMSSFDGLRPDCTSTGWRLLADGHTEPDAVRRSPICG